VDNLIGWHWQSWAGSIIAAALGVGGAIAQLATSYRPPKDPS
jgi:hypothetical protein